MLCVGAIVSNYACRILLLYDGTTPAAGFRLVHINKPHTGTSVRTDAFETEDTIRSLTDWNAKNFRFLKLRKPDRQHMFKTRQRLIATTTNR